MTALLEIDGLTAGDPVEVRVRNALREGARMPTGQLVDGPAPVAELLRRVQSAPPAPSTQPDQGRIPPIVRQAPRRSARP